MAFGGVNALNAASQNILDLVLECRQDLQQQAQLQLLNANTLGCVWISWKYTTIHNDMAAGSGLWVCRISAAGYGLRDLDSGFLVLRYVSVRYCVPVP